MQRHARATTDDERSPASAPQRRAGQVRRWSKYCQRYDGCERPVYFVRMDNGPFKLGSWKQRSKATVQAARPAAAADSPF